MTEPPSTAPRSGSWRTTVAIVNQGSSTAPSGQLRVFLSRGRRFTRDDFARTITATPSIQRRYPRLRAQRALVRRLTLRLPRSVTRGRYYVVICLPDARVNSDDLRCHFSGLAMRFGPEPTGPEARVGATGAAGGTGADGANGVAGAHGPAGANGAAGANGVAGAQGQTGAAGVGLQGPQGAAGAPGTPGADGAIGPQGPPGPQGPKGDPGEPGPPGGFGG